MSPSIPALAQTGPATAPALPRAGQDLTRRQKAAIVVRLMLSEGASLPLATLPDEVQTELTLQMGQMHSIDRQTLQSVVAEFLAELEGIGLSFPNGIEGALSVLGTAISPGTANRARAAAGGGTGDPWLRIAAMPPEQLLPVLQEESVEIGAVLLSKIAVGKAAELLSRMPGERARRITYAVSQTGSIGPDTVHRIGMSLASQLDAQPERAFGADPVERVGAILNVSPSATRDDVLAGLDEADARFANDVRRAIFTFIHIPERIDPRDIPKVTRAVDPVVLVTALAAAKDDLAPAAEFILANMSQRMAAQLRDEAAARGKVKDKDGEAAMAEIISAIRDMAVSGQIALVTEEEAS